LGISENQKATAKTTLKALKAFSSLTTAQLSSHDASLLNFSLKAAHLSLLVVEHHLRNLASRCFFISGLTKWRKLFNLEILLLLIPC
jgi:hypothetical protein